MTLAAALAQGFSPSESCLERQQSQSPGTALITPLESIGVFQHFSEHLHSAADAEYHPASRSMTLQCLRQTTALQSLQILQGLLAALAIEACCYVRAYR